jgi:hypothetical protein
MNFKPLHLWVGLAGLVVFPITGLYMAQIHNGLADMADGPRMAYRTAHIYLFFASALNLLLGLYIKPCVRSLWARRSETAASLILLGGPLFYIVGFFSESQVGVGSRPITQLTTIALFIGIILLAISRSLENRATTGE